MPNNIKFIYGGTVTGPVLWLCAQKGVGLSLNSVEAFLLHSDQGDVGERNSVHLALDAAAAHLVSYASPNV